MKLPSKLLTKKTQLFINTNQWFVSEYNYTITNTDDVSLCSEVTDNKDIQKEFNKLGKLELLNTNTNKAKMYEVLDRVEVTVELTRKQLKILLEFTDKKSNKYYAHGIWFRANSVIATDAYRLCSMEYTPVSVAQDSAAVCVPVEVIEAMLAASDSDKFLFEVGTGGVKITGSDVRLSGRVISGTLPPVSEVLDTTGCKLESVTLTKEMEVEAVRHSGCVSGETLGVHTDKYYKLDDVKLCVSITGSNYCYVNGNLLVFEGKGVKAVMVTRNY